MMTFALGMGMSVNASLMKNIVWGTQYQNNGLVQYVVSYTNTGSSPVTIRLTDTLPSSLMLLPWATATCDGTVSPWSSFVVSIAGQSFSTNYCTLAPWEQASMMYSSLILSQSFSTIINTAIAAQYSGATFLSNQNASASFSSFPVLSVNKLFTWANPQQLNDLVTFKIKVTNSGAAIANNIVVRDNIPNGFEFVSSTLPGTPSIDATTNTVSWIIPALAANSSSEYTVIAKLATSIPGAWLTIGSSVINTATIATGTTSLPSYMVFWTNQSQANFTIAGIPSVKLTKVLTSPSNGIVLLSWSSVSYTITVTNTGTDTAVWSITDILPWELTWFSASITPSVMNGNTWTWTGITLDAWESMTITIDAILWSNYASNRVFTNTANFSYATNTPTGWLINNGVVTGLIQWLPNLVLNKSLVKSATSGQSGDVVVYSLTVTNSSAIAYTGSRCIVDTLPSQFALTSSSSTQSNCSSSMSSSQIGFSWTWFPKTIVLTGILNNDYNSGTVVNNTAQVYNTQELPELMSSDNTSSASFTIGGRDISLTKSVWATSYTGTPGTVVTYTLQYTNNGTVPASGVVLSDNLPNNLVYNTSTRSWAILSGSNIMRNIGTLNPGQSGSVTFTALISWYIEGGIITNTASLSTVDSESNLQNNTSSISFTVTPAIADVRVVKSIASQGTYLSGTQYTFRFDISNIGGTTATGIVLSDILPSLFTYVSASTNLIAPTGSLINLTTVWNTVNSDWFSLSAGQSWYVLITVVLNNNILTTTNYINTGTITASTVESLLTNNTSSVNGTITAPVISCSWLNYTVTALSPLSNPVGLTTLSGLAVWYTYSLVNNLAVPIETLSINTTWPSQVSLPSNLTAWLVASASNIPVWSWVSYSLNGNTIVDGISTISTPATFTIKVAWGQPFTCTANSTISVSQSCGNNTINSNLGEQCENYNGTVIVAPWVSFDSTTQSCDASCKVKTTKITNCVFMDVSGTIKNACVDTITQPENPVLTIKKYVNNNDAQDNSTAVAISNGSMASYRVVITNTSSFTAYNVRFTDVVPNGVNYINNSVIPNTISYTSSTRTLAGNLGTLAPGASFTVTFDATVNSLNGYVTNIATVNYTDVLGVTKPELSDPAVITLGASLCNNGIKDSGEQCDLGNLPSTIGNYLDTTNSFPSYSDRGKICNTSCQIVNSVSSRCGDGIVGRLEQCDMGNNSNSYNGWTIWAYLDAIGQNFPSGIYAGKYCTSSCLIDSPDAPAAPACRYTDTVISIMKDEIFPFSWDVELGEGNIISNEDQCNTSNAWALIEDSLECVFEIYNKNEEATNWLTLRKQVSYGCRVDQWADYNLFKPLYGTENALFAEKPRGTYKITLDDSILNDNYGEYKLSLEKVKYKYCDANGKVLQGNPYARVCQVNFAVTDNYLMQKWSVSSKTNSDLSNYYMLNGSDIYRSIDLDKVSKLSSLNYANISSSMKTLTNNLISKYEKIAVTATLSDTQVKKVPGKSIYIMPWWKTFKGADLSVPTTIIVKGDVNIEWNISKNILLIATGKIKFTLPTPDRWIDSCETQIVNGIIVAQWWFAATPNNGYKNTNLNNPRCRKGNLQVYWVLVGNNLDDLVNSRRSHLEHWFTFKRNGSTITVNDSEVKAERRDEIYKGASVYIEQNPSLWRDMPPAADEFLKSLNVSRS